MLNVFKDVKDQQEKVAKSLDDLVPGDRGHFMNFTTMRNDPYAAEFVMHMGKKDGKHMFRGHPYKTEISYEEMIASLITHYKEWRDMHPEQIDEIKLQEDYKNKKILLYPDIIGGYAPGLYKILEKPNVVKLYDLK